MNGPISKTAIPVLILAVTGASSLRVSGAADESNAVSLWRRSFGVLVKPEEVCEC
jgi:hypothetical protein